MLLQLTASSWSVVDPGAICSFGVNGSCLLAIREEGNHVRANADLRDVDSQPRRLFLQHLLPCPYIGRAEADLLDLGHQGLLANAQAAGSRRFGTAIDKALLAVDRVPGTRIPKSHEVVRGWIAQHLDNACARQRDVG